jgi:hypothetical protein
VAASLPILSVFTPKKWKSADRSTNPTTPSRLPYIGSTRRTSVNRKCEGSVREENIMRTDEIELIFKTRSQYFREKNHQGVLSNSSIRSISEAGENDNQFSMGQDQDRDGIFPITDHKNLGRTCGLKMSLYNLSSSELLQNVSPMMRNGRKVSQLRYYLLHRIL